MNLLFFSVFVLQFILFPSPFWTFPLFLNICHFCQQVLTLYLLSLPPSEPFFCFYISSTSVNKYLPSTYYISLDLCYKSQCISGRTNDWSTDRAGDALMLCIFGSARSCSQSRSNPRAVLVWTGRANPPPPQWAQRAWEMTVIVRSDKWRCLFQLICSLAGPVI